MPNEPQTPATPQAGGAGDPQPQAGNSTPQAGNETPTVSTEDLQRQLAEVRREAQNLRKRFKDQEDAATLAEQQRLAEQGEFKKLAEKHEAKVRELEPVATSYTKLAEQINAQIEAEIKDWPAEVKNLVPPAEIALPNGERRITPVEERLEQMVKLRPLLEKLQTQARTQLPGNRPNPSVATPAATKQAQLEANRAALLKQRGYNI